MKRTQISYLHVVRLIFVFFSLYLVRDAFYRWDGYRINRTFLDFVPSIALTAILWSIIALIAATLIWLLLRILEWFCMRIGWKVRMEYVLTFLGFLVMLTLIFWAGKRLILSDTPIHSILKLIFVSCLFLGAIFLTWKFRDKPSMIHERITPLVWIFGAIIVLSFPIVIYHTWIKPEDTPAVKEAAQYTGVDRKNLNIILVTFDALTARDMSVYGYYRTTTPFISEWSKNATLFTNAHAGSNATRPTTTSLVTGKRVWTHRIYHNINAWKQNNSTENLGRELKKNGYYTMALTANAAANVERLGVSNGFDVAVREVDLTYSHGLKKIDTLLTHLFENKIHFYDWILQEDFIFRIFMDKISEDYNETFVPADLAFNRFLSTIDANPKSPFFAWIHLMPPHSPYLPPAPFMGMFDPSAQKRTFKQQQEIIDGNLVEILRGNMIDEKVFTEHANSFRARYDEFIRYCDSEFERFIEELKRRNLLENSVVILSADHGESFEHNSPAHGGLPLYEQMTSIPLIIKEPDQKEGKIIHDLVEQVDIPATILDLAQTEVPLWMEGYSLLPLMRGNNHLLRPIFSMSLYENPGRGEITKGTVAVWENEYKLIHYLEKNKSLLFNLKQDPGEMNNLIDKEHETGQHLLGIIHDNLKKVNDRITIRQ